MKIGSGKSGDTDGKPGKLEKFKPLIRLVVWLVISAAVYMALYKYVAISMIYMIVGCALFVCFVIVNGGLERRKPEALPRPEGMGDAEFETLKLRMKQRMDIAQWLMTISVPLICVPMADYVILMLVNK